jgi:hypothetical protein
MAVPACRCQAADRVLGIGYPRSAGASSTDLDAIDFSA